MQITEVLTDGLHREFRIVVDAGALDEKLTGRLAEMQPRLHLKGFRPGKAPVSFLKKTYGKSLMGEIVQAVISESMEKTIKEHELHPAVMPRYDFANEIETVIAGRADLEFTMKVDLMPDFELANLSELQVERLVADVEDSDIDEWLKRLAEAQRLFLPKGEGAGAEMGDSVVIDFEGKIDGVAFDGGKAENFALVLGSGGFVPGFEDQLVGAKVGDARTVVVTFPEDYGAPDLAGKMAEFAVTVKEVKAAEPVAIDNELAKRLGVDSLATLKERVREQAKGDFQRASRTHLKRRLLDALDAAHAFELPPAMVSFEFDAIWRQVEAELKRENRTAEDEGKSEEDLKAEYRGIAERRVRLGLVLSKIGEQNGLVVTDDEIARAVTGRARQFPGREQQVFDYYAQNPNMLAEVRAPLFEDKVVDFVGELAQVTDHKVDRKTLFLDPDEAAEKLQAETHGKHKATEKAKSKAKPEKSKDKKK